MDIINNIIKALPNSDWQLSVAGILGIIASIAASILINRASSKIEEPSTTTAEMQIQEEARIRDQTPRESEKTISDDVKGVLHRLTETRLALRQQESSARRLRLASTTLTTGQYIVGLGLTSSFLQEQLSPNIIGILGLIVLISSTIQERYRPAVQYRGAMERILRLKVLIRQVEDDLHSFRLGREEAPDMLELRRKISLALSDIDASEIRDLDTRLQATEQPENPKK